MPNGITPEGDDQKWKREVDKKLRELEEAIRIVNSRRGGK